MIRALKLARLPIAATIAMAVALLLFPGRQELVLDVYVLVLGGFVLAVLVSPPSGGRTPSPRRRRSNVRCGGARCAASDCPTSSESSAS